MYCVYGRIQVHVYMQSYLLSLVEWSTVWREHVNTFLSPLSSSNSESSVTDTLGFEGGASKTRIKGTISNPDNGLLTKSC